MSQKMTTSFQFWHLMNLIYGNLPKQVSSSHKYNRTDLGEMKLDMYPTENYDFKGIVHLKMNILSEFTHPHVIPTP